MCTANGSLTVAAVSSARVRLRRGVPVTVAAADELQLIRELSEGAAADRAGTAAAGWGQMKWPMAHTVWTVTVLSEGVR
jgi:hypothetical protein